MKDYEANILKAFVFALAKQSSPLDDKTQSQLNQISTNLLENIGQLDEIALNHPTISQIYSDALEWLEPLQEKNKGRSFIPDATLEKQNNEIIENISRLPDIKSDDISKFARSHLQSKDSVKDIQDNLPQFLANPPF